MEPHPQLNKFLQPYSEPVQEIALELREFVTSIIPEANELIYDNYNAVAIAYSKSEKLKDAFCHIAVYSKYVNFGFNRGAELFHPDLTLEGKGKLIRHITVHAMNAFPKEAIQKLLWDAVGLSEQLNPTLLNKEDLGWSRVMSISEKKRRPK